jgi:putative endonuclease
MNNRKLLGNKGEERVVVYLEQQNVTILEKNFTCRYGEIDIIAQKNGLIAFIEVKTRTHKLFPLSQIITPTKQQKIIRSAHYFLVKYFSGSADTMRHRFDIAMVTYENGQEEINYIPNAFTASTDRWLHVGSIG